MPWPERDALSRLVAGVVGAVLGALLGIMTVAVWLRYWTYNSPTSLVLYCAGIGGVLGFTVAFFFGDPAVRFLWSLL